MNTKTIYFLKRFCFLRSRRQTQSIQVVREWIENWESMVTILEHEMLGGANPILVELLAVNGGSTIEIVDNVASVTPVENVDFPVIIQTDAGRCFSVVGTVGDYKIVNSFMKYLFKDIDTGKETTDYKIAELFYKSGDDVVFMYMNTEEIVDDFYLYDSHRIIKAGGTLYIFEE